MTTLEPARSLVALDLVEALFDRSHDAIVVLDVLGTVVRANPEAQRLLGDDIVGAEFGVPIAAGDSAEVDLTTPGGPRVAELRAVSADLDGEEATVVSLRDITARVVAQEAQRGFVGTVSHEFRTPLFAIAGFADTLRGSWDDLSDADKIRYVEIVERQASRLTRLVDDLLALARLDEDAVESRPQPTRVRDAVRAVTDVLDLHVEVEGPDAVALVDPDHLETVVLNLVGNAVKYGAPPFRFEAHEVDDRVELWVVDHGRGVPATFRAQMFERFTRLPEDTRNIHGSGLGLSIVQGLLERNGGRIHYRDTDGGGATFVVELTRA